MKFRPSYILCLDAGLANCGAALWSVQGKRFVWSECLVTKQQAREKLAASNLRRSAELAKGLAAIMAGRRILKVVAEIPHGGAQSASAMSAMAIATAIVGATCSVLGIGVVSIAPNEIKRLVSSSRKVPKGVVQRYVKGSYDCRNLKRNRNGKLNEHVADAVGAFAVYQSQQGK